ncbi:universal stress protein [Kitasatospora sp. MAP5-34]|uniref:universal stress protein n=1 Tax=Kitasatospora sp. MAP5-34 TaxID=3035102 RepID=UPI0024730F57|nr:universal stress protein [Kitasatospora sp. MAP5-34]MDH6575241.1 nucleotide-binding universal stress UspA family protein [Kitasatospora sp. MAP5-34]
MIGRSPAGVVAGVDGSPHAAIAADWAAREAERRDCALHLVHAVNTGTVTLSPRASAAVTDLILQNAQAVLDEALGKLQAAHPTVRLTGDVVPRDAAAAVLNAAEHAELAVVGTRGHGGFASLLLGSVSLTVVAHSLCPAVVVRPAPESGGHILVAIRDERDGVILRFALREAELLGLPVHAVHTWSTIVPGLSHLAPGADDRGEEALLHEQLLRRVVDAVQPEFPDVIVEARQLTGATAAVLVEESKEAALLVMARHEPTQHFGLRLGTAVHAVLHHAHCPVAVVPL